MTSCRITGCRSGPSLTTRTRTDKRREKGQASPCWPDCKNPIETLHQQLGPTWKLPINLTCHLNIRDYRLTTRRNFVLAEVLHHLIYVINPLEVWDKLMPSTDWFWLAEFSACHKLPLLLGKGESLQNKNFGYIFLGWWRDSQHLHISPPSGKSWIRGGDADRVSGWIIITKEIDL